MSFQQDITIITSSKEFRRMQDKTQLFYSRKSDHYRTRLTHTLEVCDIALEIAEKLRNEYASGNIESYLQCKNLDDKLITAIAYGHDIGHTPFGHIGERILSDILGGKDNLGGLIKTDKILKQCFKHNVNSFRILPKDEFKDADKKTVSWQTLDGVLKHTKVYKEKTEYEHLDPNVRSDPYQIKKAYSKGVFGGGNDELRPLKELSVAETGENFDYYQHNYALTIEGQIVALADEIAQRISDFDDAVRAGFWKPSKNDFSLDGKQIAFYTANRKLIDDLKDVAKSKNNVTEICKKLRQFLIVNVEFFPEKMDAQTFKGQEVYFGKCINFNRRGEETNTIFDKINKDYIIKCKEIRKCDGISKHVIRQLFKAYYNDVSQLSDSCLKQLYSDLTKRALAMLKNPKVHTNTRKYSEDDITDKGKHIVDIGNKMAFINSIKSACLDQNIEDIKNKLRQINVSYAEIFSELTKDEQTVKSISITHKEMLEEIDFRKSWLPELHSIILRNIAFFIAGMTDSFARDEYQRLYSIKMPMNTY